MKNNQKATRRGVRKARNGRTRKGLGPSLKAARLKTPGDSNPARKLLMAGTHTPGTALSHQQRRREALVDAAWGKDAA